MVVVNNNPDHHQYKQWQSFELSDKNRKQILIPPMFGNGHLVLTDLAIFNYKQTTEYNREGQFTIIWNDPSTIFLGQLINQFSQKEIVAHERNQFL